MDALDDGNSTVLQENFPHRYKIKVKRQQGWIETGELLIQEWPISMHFILMFIVKTETGSSTTSTEVFAETICSLVGFVSKGYKQSLDGSFFW